MTKKQHIEEGESLLKKYKKLHAEMDSLPTNPEEATLQLLYKGLLAVLQIEAIKVTERIPQIEKRLAEMKKEYTVEFEKASMEANRDMHIILNQAKQYIGKEPLGVSGKIQPLIDRYEAGVEQEEKNAIFDELKGHIGFMKKTSKR